MNLDRFASTGSPRPTVPITTSGSARTCRPWPFGGPDRGRSWVRGDRFRSGPGPGPSDSTPFGAAPDAISQPSDPQHTSLTNFCRRY
jgi:hypothetical protein